MGILLAIPEIVTATVAAGAEAAEIAGGFSAIAEGAGVAALESIQGSAAALGEAAIPISNEVATVLTQTPALVETVHAVNAVAQGAAGLTGGIYSALSIDSPGELPPHTGSSGSSGGYNSFTAGNSYNKPESGMALAFFDQYQLESGIPGVPDWLFNIIANSVPELPSLQEIFYSIANGIWTSYYNTGRAVVERTVSEELQRLLRDLDNGFRTTFQNLRTSDPVEGIIDQIRGVANLQNIEQVAGRAASGLSRAAQQAVRNTAEAVGRATGDAAANAASTAITAVGGAASSAAQTVSDAVSAAVQATQDLASHTGRLTYDIANLPNDGFNALSEGVHRLGQWIQMVGSTGGTHHYAAPQWILFVLDQLEEELYKKPIASVKRAASNYDNSEKRKKYKKSGPAVTKANKKRRSRSARRSTVVRGHAV